MSFLDCQILSDPVARGHDAYPDSQKEAFMKTLNCSLSSPSLGALLLAGNSLLFICAAGCHRKADVAADQPVPVRLRAPNRLRQPVSVAASGSVEANVTALTAFQVDGRVAHVYVDEGQYVKQGQVLADLDRADYQNALDGAQGQAAAADAVALQAKNGLRAQELEEARIDFERTQDEYQRLKYLYDHQSLPANDFHKIEAAYLASRQRYDMAQQGARSEEKDAARGQAHAANAQLSEAKKHLADCSLRAPISGFIGMRRVNVGDTVAPGNPVFSVLDLDSVKVRVGIPEAEIGKVREGASAVVIIPSLDNQRFEGKVEAVGVSADPVSRTFAAKITVPNPTHILRAGMVSESRIYGSKMENVLTVPALAIMHDPRDVPLVYVYDGMRQRVFARRVEIGDLAESEVQIKSGLDSGELIVIAGQQNVHEGSQVRVVGDGQ
jgi:RND family efflux transporter MFP subunit